MSTIDVSQQRWAIYLRLSQNRDGDDRKGDRQLKACEAWLRSRGVISWVVYIDDDRSAYKGKPRADWKRLTTDIDGAQVTHFVSLHVDRMLRDMSELVDLVKLVERTNAMVYTVESGAFDLNNAASRQTAYMIGAMAEGESARKAERHQLKAAQLRAEGKSQGGSRPFGWESPNGALRPAEAALIYQATMDLLNAKETGTTLYSIRKQWNASGLSTSSHRTAARAARVDGGGTWANNKAVARILMRYRNAGKMEHEGKVVGSAIWPAISVEAERPITEEQVRAIREMLTDPERRSTPGPTRKHLLSGIATCAKCGHVLRKTQGGHGAAYYRCSNQPTCYLSIQVQPLDDLVTLVVRSRFTHEDPANFATSPNDREKMVTLRSEKAAIDATASQVGDAVGRGEIPFQAQQAALRGLQARKVEIDHTLGLIASRIATAEMLMVVTEDDGLLDRGVAVKRRWSTLTLDKRRAIIQELYSSIVVSPGRGAVGKRVRLARRPRP